jgi:hypothetical protein
MPHPRPYRPITRGAALTARDTTLRYLTHLERNLRAEAQSARITQDRDAAAQRDAEAQAVLQIRMMIINRPTDGGI